MRNFRLLVVLSIIILGVLLVWTARRPLTEAAVARWFTAQGVEARYRVTALSPTAITLADVSLGPGARPDFTAARIDATVGWSPLRPRLATIRLVKPDLRATLSSNGISFGGLDRLLPAPDGARGLPDIDLTIEAGRLRVATPSGSLDGVVTGSGRLGGGFRGRWGLVPTVLKASGCEAALTGGGVTLATTRDAVRVAAAGVLPRLACAQGVAEQVDWHVAATLPPTLDRYAARFDARAARIAGGDYQGQALVLRGDAAAPALSGPIAGTTSAQIERLRGPSFVAGTVAAAGPFGYDPQADVGSVAAAVKVSRASASPVTAALRGRSRQFTGTLAQPLYDALLTRGSAAARSFDASASVAVRRDATGFTAELTGLNARAATGARVQQAGRVTIAPGGTVLNGGVTVSGGGLPSLTLTGFGSVRGGRPAGVATLVSRPWAVAGAVVQDLRVEARSDAGRTTLNGLVRASGAVGGGIVADRLNVPIALAIDSRGGLTIGAQCLAFDWGRLTRDTIAFERGAARLCPAGDAIARLKDGRLQGQAILAPLRLRGRSAGTPLSVATAALQLQLSGSTERPHMTLAPAQVTVGYGTTQVAAIVGGVVDLADARAAGTLAAASLDVPGSPVSIDASGGRWRFADGRLALADGAARITDRTRPARFEPLRVDDVSATLNNGLLAARGAGRLAATGARLFDFTATHTLASGRGAAAVETGTLRFGPDLQPYQITEALRGIVANVVGPVNGKGRIVWNGTKLISGGTLAVDHVSLATTSLGPVDDVFGTLSFDDLFAVTTPPRQLLTIKRINPGVAVEDGVVRFQMLGPGAATIESIVWPYAGGTLTLAPVTIRTGDLTRTFNLTVDGLDAEQFLQKFEIKDVNVTGRFDGKLPLIFTDGKGRIAGGSLVARDGGGLLSYVGAVGGEDLGAGARLAFDALRRLRYRSLALELDGDLDGELVTQLRFAGTNEAATTLGGGPLPIRATGLPFRFNVTVRAPFRALLGTAASFSDVRPLIRPSATGVQPQ